MLRKILLPTVVVLLAWGFWISPDFKEIAAGVAIFLFGMLSLEEGFRVFSGGMLEKFLHRSTDKTYKSLGFGVIATTLMQSSSLVSVITISFLSAGMIDLCAGLGIVFGANLGTTTGAWLVAGFGLKVKISAYAMPMLVFGVLLIFQKARSLKGIGYILSGLGFLFLGIHHMKVGFESFKETIDLAAYAVSGYPGLFLFALMGLLATVVMQSSHATLVLIITALAGGQITYENALALAIGANVGTTITAILGSFGAGVQGRRLAGGHLVFNLVTGFVAIGFIHQFMVGVDSVSQALGIAANDYALKLAVFHTLFNSAGILLMVPFLKPLARGLERVMPGKEPETTKPQYLKDATLEFADTALDALRQETLHLYDEAFKIISHGIDLHRSEVLSEVPFAQILERRRTYDSIQIDIDEDYERTVKVLHGAILEYISRAQSSLPRGQGELLLDFRMAARNIVASVKDIKHLRKNLALYKVSSNQGIKEAYNGIRTLLGRVLREIALLRRIVEEEGHVAIVDLDALRLEIMQADVLRDGSLDKLIRTGSVTPEMSTSLINDSAYALSAAGHLIDMAIVVFAASESSELKAERQLVLSPDEIEDLLHATNTEGPRA
ncbi:MAG: Na/Pi cotransporter family protein [bacterium]|nr:Na/Pi cotransporter family protein [bacterium]